MQLPLGQSVPAFTLPAASGSTYSLEEDSSTRPGWRLLVYFRGSW
ncbi:hypothetical protein [Alkalicoccus chagannorensis]|nr:hypothetical protein [Alkalicoccus chagannorensis]